MRFLLVVLGLVVALLGCVVMAKGNDSSFLRGSPLLIAGAVMFAAGGAAIDVIAALKGRPE